MKYLQRCSILIETFARFGAVRDEWAAEAGESFDALEPLLQPTDRLSSNWPGRIPSRPPRRVVALGDERFRAVCDEGLSDPVELSRDQLALYRVDERLLRSTICTALGLTISRDQLRPLPGLLRIGQWRYSQAAGCPVWLASAPTPGGLSELLREAGEAGTGPLIVLLLTRNAWTTEAERAAPATRCMVTTLDEVIGVDEGAWVASECWDLGLGEFVKAAGIKVAGGFSALKKKTRVAKAGGTAAKLKAELKQWYRSARKHLLDTGELLPAPELKQIAEGCGIDHSTVSRWLNGKYRENDKELKILWENIANPEYVRTFRG